MKRNVHLKKVDNPPRKGDGESSAMRASEAAPEALCLPAREQSDSSVPLPVYAALNSRLHRPTTERG